MRTAGGADRARDGSARRRVVVILFAVAFLPGVALAQSAPPDQQPVTPETAPDVGTVTPDLTATDPGGKPASKHPPPAPIVPVTPPEPAPVAPIATPADGDTPQSPPPFVDFQEQPATDAPQEPASAGTDAVPGDAPQAPHMPSRRQLCTKPEEGDESVADEMQETMEETTCAAALWLDGLFVR